MKNTKLAIVIGLIFTAVSMYSCDDDNPTPSASPSPTATAAAGAWLQISDWIDCADLNQECPGREGFTVTNDGAEECLAWYFTA